MSETKIKTSHLEPSSSRIVVDIDSASLLELVQLGLRKYIARLLPRLYCVSGLLSMLHVTIVG